MDDKWKKYRLKYCKEFRIENPDYHSNYYHENKEKYVNDYLKKHTEQKQRIKAGYEPLPRTKRTKRELAVMREKRLLKNLKKKAIAFKETLKTQNTN